MATWKEAVLIASRAAADAAVVSRYVESACVVSDTPRAAFPSYDVRDKNFVEKFPKICHTLLATPSTLQLFGWAKALKLYTRCLAGCIAPQHDAGRTAFLEVLRSVHPHGNRFAVQLAEAFPPLSDVARTKLFNWVKHPAAWGDALAVVAGQRTTATPWHTLASLLRGGAYASATRLASGLRPSEVPKDFAQFLPRRGERDLELRSSRLFHAVIVDRGIAPSVQGSDVLLGLDWHFLRRGCGFGLVELTLSEGRTIRTDDLVRAGLVERADHVVGMALVSTRSGGSRMIVDSLAVEWSEQCVDILTLLGWM